jgi:hypothetical protein
VQSATSEFGAMKSPERIRAEALAAERGAAEYLRRQGFYDNSNKRVSEAVQHDAAGHQQATESSVMSTKMSAEESAGWNVWARGIADQAVAEAFGLERAARRECDKTIMDEFVAPLRRAVRELQNQPPLFAASDKKLNATMSRVGDELHAQREAIEALRADADKYAEKTDIDALRHRFIAKIAELELAHETTAENVRGLSSGIHNLANSVDRAYTLLAKLASALDCEHVLDAVDRHHLPEGEQKSAERPGAPPVLGCDGRADDSPDRTERGACRSLAVPLLSRVASCAGLVSLRQTFVRRRQNGVAWAAVITRRARPARVRPLWRLKVPVMPEIARPSRRLYSYFSVSNCLTSAARCGAMGVVRAP